MAERDFREVIGRQNADGYHAVVGLDTDFSKVQKKLKSGLILPGNPSDPAEKVVAYNRLIIEATHDTVAGFKAQSSFYEALGERGAWALKETREAVREVAPHVLFTVDAKRGDIDNTNLGYIQAFFDYIDADAITIQPYLGGESLRPFFDQIYRGFFIMGRTSNKGAGEFQDLIQHLNKTQARALLNGPVRQLGRDVPRVTRMPLYKYMAHRVANHWNVNGNLGLVAGATWPGESGEIRDIVGPDFPLLIPGVGAQGGKAKDIVPQALRKGSLGIINSSRETTFAEPQGNETQQDASRRAALKLHNEIVTAQEQAA